MNIFIIYVYLYIVVFPLLYWTADRCSPKLCFIKILFRRISTGRQRNRCEDWEGATAVHLAIKGGHAEVCRFLMEAKADPQEALDFGTSAGPNKPPWPCSKKPMLSYLIRKYHWYAMVRHEIHSKITW